MLGLQLSPTRPRHFLCTTKLQAKSKFWYFGESRSNRKGKHTFALKALFANSPYEVRTIHTPKLYVSGKGEHVERGGYLVGASK